jgi:nucleotide-binding universal stress UspA family protein
MPAGLEAIVCAVDFSGFSSLVVAHGAALARRADLPLHLVHAIHFPQDDLHPTSRLEQGGNLDAQREAAHQRMATLMRGLDVDWANAVVFGEPVARLTAFVEALPPCMMVTASHGISGFRRLFIGTVVERLTRRLDRPVLVAKPVEPGIGRPEGGFGSILMACDANDHWQAAAALLPPLLAEANAHLHLLHVMEGPLADAPRETDGRQPYGDFQLGQQARVHANLADKARNRFPQPGQVQFSVEVASGIPEEVLLQAAERQQADLVIVGVRASAKVGRWLAGSTTEAILRRSPCSVLTLPVPPRSSNRNAPP